MLEFLFAILAMLTACPLGSIYGAGCPCCGECSQCMTGTTPASGWLLTATGWTNGSSYLFGIPACGSTQCDLLNGDFIATYIDTFPWGGSASSSTRCVWQYLFAPSPCAGGAPGSTMTYQTYTLFLQGSGSTDMSYAASFLVYPVGGSQATTHRGWAAVFPRDALEVVSKSDCTIPRSLVANSPISFMPCSQSTANLDISPL